MDTSVDSNGIELVSMAAIEDEAEKRAHHNALERKRRDHIKDSFYCLRDSVPQLRGEKASRALILNKATDYIKSLKSKNMCHKKEIDDIKKQNDVLEQEIDKIIKLNNSLGKDRIELVGEDFVKVSENSDTATTPQSTPPTFTRITEKDRGPCIGKRELDSAEENIETKVDDQTTVMKITKPIEKSENVPDNKADVKNPPRITIGPLKQQTAKISFAQAGGVTKNGTGTIQIPASALAKALPNGFKNVTAIYKQTGNNKPIRLQIITHNGSCSTTAGALFAVRNCSPKKNSENTKEKEKKDEDKNSIIKNSIIKNSIIKNLGDININSSKSEEQKKDPEPKEAAKEDKTTEKEEKKEESPSPEKRQMSGGPRTLQNQPLYARHRILHASPSKEKKQVKEKPAENSGVLEFDSYKTQHHCPGNSSERSTPRTHSQLQALQRDPSAIATISESELAFLTRPSTTTAGKEDGTATNDRTVPPKERGRAGKIEHGNIPILYKGSLLSDRDKEIDDEREPQKLVLYSARAMDGSRPFACHICGKSFNMLSSLKVHEHIHVPVKKKPYPCDLCHRSFMTLRILSQHKESHYGRISTFHRQSSLGKKSQVSFATHPQSVKNGNTGSDNRSPRTSITNIFHVRASSPNDAPHEKKYSTITITPSKGTVAVSHKGLTKSSNQRLLPTTRVRQGQVIVQARPGAGATAYKVRTKAECEEARNFGLKVVPFKRSTPLSEFGEKKIKVEAPTKIPKI